MTESTIALPDCIVIRLVFPDGWSLSLPDQRHTYKSPEEGPSAIGYAAVGLAWLVPGAGHLAIGQRGRGLLFLVTIHTLFALGLLLGGVHAMNPPEQPIWSYTQLLAGWPTLAANVLSRQRAAVEGPALRELQLGGESMDPERRQELLREIGTYSPKVQDVGTVYCGLAGMLNLLLIFDVLVRVTATPKEAT